MWGAVTVHAEEGSAKPPRNFRVAPSAVEEPLISTFGSKIILGLGLCMIVLLGGVAVARRCGLVDARSTRRTMKVIERLPLSAKSSLCVVEIEGKNIILAVGSERVTVVKSENDVLTNSSQLSFEDLVCDGSDAVSAC